MSVKIFGDLGCRRPSEDQLPLMVVAERAGHCTDADPCRIGPFVDHFEVVEKAGVKGITGGAEPDSCMREGGH
jgi:hypothetical protein